MDPALSFSPALYYVFVRLAYLVRPTHASLWALLAASWIWQQVKCIKAMATKQSNEGTDSGGRARSSKKFSGIGYGEGYFGSGSRVVRIAKEHYALRPPLSLRSITKSGQIAP